jgi:release factor glutamine methyltransferase
MKVTRRNDHKGTAACGGASVERSDGAPAVMEAVKLAEAYLAGHGIESPRLNAEHLLAWILGCTRLDLYLRFDDRLSDDVRTRFRENLKRRARHYPLQYITGAVEFFSLPFTVREGIFVPRPETEMLVERVEALLPHGTSLRFIEMGVGSGVVSATLAVRHPSWRGVAFDVSTEAALLAKENAETLGVSNRLSICVADGFDSFSARRIFDLLVANPPYIPTVEIDDLPEEVSRYESRVALDGGADGMRYFTMLARAGVTLLRDGGLIAVEIGEDQARRVEELLRLDGYRRIEMSRDYNGTERVMTAFRPEAEGGSDG